jgi:photosystem II stability/assembly factor-like uncharacterized protein
MKRIITNKVLFLLLTFCNIAIYNISYSQFIQKSNGLNGGCVNCFATAPGRIFAGTTYGGVYTSTDIGNNWININNDIQNFYTEDVMIKGNSIFVGCTQMPIFGDGGFGIYNFLFRSTNNGNNWEVIQDGINSPGISVYSLFTLDSFIFAGTNNGIYRATDSTCIIWKKTGAAGTITNVFANNENIIFTGSNNGVFRSFNMGDDWEMASYGLGNSYTTSLCVKNNKIFAGTNNGVYVSSNNGNNWSAVNNGLTNNIINSLAAYDNYLLAGTAEGLFMSTNDGLKWVLKNSGIPNSHFFAIKYDGTNIFAGACLYYPGIYKSTNNGQNWQKSDNGLYAASVRNITSTGNIIFATIQGQGVFKSTNFGEIWEEVNNGISSPYVRCIESIDNNIFVGCLTKIYISTNYGISWESASEGLNVTVEVLSLHKYGNTLYAGTFNSGLYKTTNNGTNWILLGLENVDIRAVLRLDNLIYVASNTEGMFLTTDEGVNWVEINNGLPSPSHLYARTLENVGNTVFLGNVQRGGIYYTTNNGANWIKRNNGTLSDSIVFSFTTHDSILFTSDYKDGLFISKNLGQNWLHRGNCLYQKDVRSLFITGGYLFIGCNGFGVMRKPLSEVISVKNLSTEVPEKYLLYQNYPNPFNPTTNIKYQVTKNNFVSLKIYNILGKEIATLVNEKQNAGTYEVRFEAVNLPSGMYFYKLVTGEFSETKKMVLIK